MLAGMKRLALGVLLAGCGGGDGSSAPDAPVSIDAPPGALAVSSTAFVDGAAIPVLYTCKDTTAGKDSSPPLVWINPPAAAQSFAVVLTDKSIGRVHWAIFDIPVAVHQLPLNIDKIYAPTAVAGAHQVSAQQGFNGYQGPCPPSQHTYEFAVYALDVAALPGASMQSLAAELVAPIQAHQLATAKLTGTFTP